MNLAVINPNFSIIVPAGCNAKCDFCFWTKPEKSLDRKEYLKNLQRVLAALPKEFTQCSITGGEPTSCSFLRDILTLVRLKFDKVVLSSNGYKVEPWLFEYIDHLNISRHRTDDLQNEKIFGTDTVPSWLRLNDICQMANEAGVDVTLNTVVEAKCKNPSIINKMIAFAKLVNANAVCFRKEHGDIEDLRIERHFPHKVVYEHGCGVCRVKERYIDGMKATFRYSVLEPSQDLGSIYELVLQPDGSVTSDWEAKNIVNVFETDARTHAKPDPRQVPYVGCGLGKYEEEEVYCECADEDCTCNETPEHSPICPACEERMAAPENTYYAATGQPDMRGCNGEIPRSCGATFVSSCGTRITRGC